MPFEETHVVDERTRFIEDVHRSARSFAAVCERYGISRKTGYKWLGRWRTGGAVGFTRPIEPTEDVSLGDATRGGGGDT